jgi:hypothetical protein
VYDAGQAAIMGSTEIPLLRMLEKIAMMLFDTAYW